MTSCNIIYKLMPILGVFLLPVSNSQYSWFPPWYEYGYGDVTEPFYYDGHIKPPYQPDDDNPSVDAVILSEFGGIDNITLCISGSKKASHSCQDRCEEKTFAIDQKCRCDAKCINYGDCCYDYEMFSNCNSQNSSIQPSSSFINESFQNISWSNYLNLIETLDIVTSFEQMNLVYNRNTTTGFEPGYDCITPSLMPSKFYYLISRCPEHSTADLQDHCTSKDTDTLHGLPWYGPDGKHYKNVFCAKCAGIDVYDQTGVNYRLEPFFGLTCSWMCDFATPDVLNNTFDLTDCMLGRNCWASEFYHDVNPALRQCNPAVVYDCPVDDPQLVKACQIYMAMIEIDFGTQSYAEYKIFKNIHCARCHNVSTNLAMDSLDCNSKPTGLPPDVGGDPITGGPGVGNTPLTVLFDFSPNSDSLQQSKYYGERPPDCPSGHVYNPHDGVCQRATCPPGGIITTWGECAFDKQGTYFAERSLGDIDPRYRTIVIDLAVLNDNFTDGLIVELVSKFWNKMDVVYYYSIEKYNRSWNEHNDHVVRDRGLWVKQVGMETEEECLQNYSIGYSVTLEGLDSNQTLYNHIEKWLDSMTYGILETMPSCQPGFTYGLSGQLKDVLISKVKTANFPSDDHLCNASAGLRPVSYGMRSFVRRQNNHTKYIQLYYDRFDNQSSYESSSLAQEAVFTGGSLYYDSWQNREGNWSRSDRVVICESMPFCPLVTLREEEYKWIFDYGNASLELLPTGRIVPPNEIVVSQDGQIQVCLMISEHHVDPPLHDNQNGQNIATIIGCAVSLTLLGIVIITYLSFAELRNIPGKTIMNLSLSLLLAQGLLIFGAGQTKIYAACLSIALIMHFFWLAVFSWANILAFDLGRTFGKGSKMKSNSGSSIFLYYSLYGWGVPLILVAATAVVHFFVSIDGLMANVYNLKTSCWIRSGYPLLVAFGIPVAIVLVLNVGFFTNTVIGIRSTMKATKILKKENDKGADMQDIRQELRLYTLLSCSIGLTWISGFIIPFMGIPDLWYLFIVFNSLQGPVIFISFTCNRRVFKLWEKKLCSALYTSTSTASKTGDSSRIDAETSQTRVPRADTNI